MITQKRSQGLPINIIVIAAIALVILIVLISIFSNRIFSVNKDLTACESKGGFCARTCSKNYIKMPFECSKDLPVCCTDSGHEPKLTITEVS